MHTSIQSTWDGNTLPAEQHVSIQLTHKDDALHIVFDAPFYDDPAPEAPVGPTPALWNHEVVEFFFSSPLNDTETVTYTELEFSPHGHYLVLQLKGIRQIKTQLLPISFQAQRHGQRWRGEVELPLSLLPDNVQLWNAYAIHGLGTERQYLAMCPVPGEKPDFHRLQHFAPYPKP